ncbi:hypothetical protein [Arthrospira platensis]|nr:hypothetical protein [Arthrospira platensis NCB002]WAK73753.1 hypothetical protein AP9108_35300 [Arthrospira sp. PCC 9108]
MVRQHGIIPWDLYSLVLTHPTAPYRTLPPYHPTGGYGRRSHHH